MKKTGRAGNSPMQIPDEHAQAETTCIHLPCNSAGW